MIEHPSAGEKYLSCKPVGCFQVDLGVVELWGKPPPEFVKTIGNYAE